MVVVNEVLKQRCLFTWSFMLWLFYIMNCRSLRSTERGVLMVPFARTATKQNRAFSVVGPSLWNGLPLALRLHPRIHSESFYSCLKTVLFSRAGVGSAPE